MKESLAFLGIGLMGAPMARNLLKAGHPVTVWNRTRAKADALAAGGAHVASTPAEAARGADVVFTMLEHDAAVESVLFAHGVDQALRAGATVIDTSSISPRGARDHARRLAERGVTHLDAPVSGGPKGAAAGTLAIMVGGEPAVFAARRPVLERLGRPTLVGPHGAGQLAKLCNQVIVALTIGAVAEGLLLAAAGGADPAAVRAALAGGFADSPILRLHGERMLGRDFVPGGRVRMQVKDLDNALDAARAGSLELPLTRRVTELFTALRDAGGSEYDHSALLLEVERRNAPARVGTAPDRLPQG